MNEGPNDTQTAVQASPLTEPQSGDTTSNVAALRELGLFNTDTNLQ